VGGGGEREKKTEKERKRGVGKGGWGGGGGGGAILMHAPRREFGFAVGRVKNERTYHNK